MRITGLLYLDCSDSIRGKLFMKAGRRLVSWLMILASAKAGLTAYRADNNSMEERKLIAVRSSLSISVAPMMNWLFGLGTIYSL